MADWGQYGGLFTYVWHGIPLEPIQISDGRGGSGTGNWVCSIKQLITNSGNLDKARRL